MPRTMLNIAAVGDIHCGRDSAGTLRPLFESLPDRTDILLLCGDLTDYGLAAEAELLVQELAPVRRIPILAVMGNHDWESGEVEGIQAILEQNEIRVLDGHTFEMEGVGFAGVKGFGGGFGRGMLEPWGEPAVKAFVDETVRESLKLERALSKLHTPHRVAILHYSPLAATVEGEPAEILPFLGSSRLEEPLNRFGTTVAFHGHAHRGAHAGLTRDGIPVYNVSLPVLRTIQPEGPFFKVFSIPLEE